MPATVYNRVKGDVTPLPDHILVINMEKGDKLTRSGIIIPDDDGKGRGIRPRWCQVYKVGCNIDWVRPGEYVLVEHGRWTYGIEMELPNGQTHYLQRVDADAILLAADAPGSDL